VYDIIIIGGGPAGMIAALYSLRNNKRVLIIEKESFGGQIATSPRVENYPTIKEISGLELSDKMFEQIADLGVEFELDEVLEIHKDKTFKVKTVYHEYEAKSVIIANGVKHRHIGVDREEEFIGHGLSYCAVCDGPFFKDQEVCVIGDANTALQSVVLLSGFCKKIHLCLLFDRFFAEEALVTKVLSLDNVDVRKEIALESIKGESEVTGLIFKDKKTNEKVEYDCQGVFIFIGQVPDNKRFENVVDIDKQGYIIADENCLTKTEGLFVAGDCRTKKIRQVTTAGGDGATAALNAVNYINNNF
jgi:thioredoxin reductase (NADPH)